MIWLFMSPVCVCLDYIAAPCSQEDDIHNVQSVIDSLSLDYLQISLSHITGMMIISFACIKEEQNFIWDQLAMVENFTLKSL